MYVLTIRCQLWPQLSSVFVEPQVLQAGQRRVNFLAGVQVGVVGDCPQVGFRNIRITRTSGIICAPQ